MDIRTEYEIRAYREQDLAFLAHIYSSSIRYLGAGIYAEAQIEAWAGFSADSEAFRRWVEGARTLVAVNEGGKCIGFAGLVEGSQISSVFVSPGSQRKGVASSLVSRLLEEARRTQNTEITTHASEFSRPLFEKFGFVVIELERTEVRGVEFERYAMRATI